MSTMSEATMRNPGFTDHADPIDGSHLPPLRMKAVPPRNPSNPSEHNIYVNGKLLQVGEAIYLGNEEGEDGDGDLTDKDYTIFESYPDVLDVSQLCDMLHIGRKSAYKLLHENQLSYRKIGRIYHIPKCSVIRFITSDDPASQSR